MSLMSKLQSFFFFNNLPVSCFRQEYRSWFMSSNLKLHSYTLNKSTQYKIIGINTTSLGMSRLQENRRINTKYFRVPPKVSYVLPKAYYMCICEVLVLALLEYNKKYTVHPVVIANLKNLRHFFENFFLFLIA